MYEYYCGDCDIKFSHWQEAGQAVKHSPCPSCSAEVPRVHGVSMIKTPSHIHSRAWEKKREQKMAQERKQEE